MNREKESPLGSLRFLTGPLAGNTYPITKPMTTLGRETANDIVISDPAVSRYHAHIIWENSTWTIKKLVTHNSLTVNQKALPEALLSDRDTIGLGPGTTFLFLIASNGSAQRNIPSSANQAPSSMPGNNVQSPQVANSAYAAQGIQNRSHPPVNQGPVITPLPPVGTPQPSIPPVSSPYVSLANIAQLGSQQETRTERALTKGSGEANQTNSPSLEVSTNTDEDKQAYPLTPDRQVFNIGRDPSNTIVINRPTISGFHVQIIREGNKLVLIHPHPSRAHTLNGLTYQGMTIRGNE